MEIPKKIRVSGIDYKIELVEEIKDDIHSPDYRGIALIKQQKIKILNSYKVDDKFRTLLHEVLHIIDDDYKLELPEDTVRRLGSGLYEILKNNNLLR